MWTYWNIAVVAIICIVTVKLIIPRLNIKDIAKMFVKAIYWPVKLVSDKAVDAIDGFNAEVDKLVKGKAKKKS